MLSEVKSITKKKRGDTFLIPSFNNASVILKPLTAASRYVVARGGASCTTFVKVNKPD